MWKVPLGTLEDEYGEAGKATGVTNIGPSLATGSGLLFIGATADERFRAFDTKTGKELWSVELSNNSPNTPMTYMGKNGKQYVTTVVSSGLNDFNKPRLASAGNNMPATFQGQFSTLKTNYKRKDQNL